MLQNLLSRTKRALLLILLCTLYAQAHGQSQYADSYFHIYIDEEPETPPQAITTFAAPPQRGELNIPLALKSNLLFDLLTLINVEIEIPINNRYSAAFEVIFPWWTMDNHKADSKRNRLQLLNGTIEGRYWWGDRAQMDLLTGWFTGVYLSLGTYDFEHDARGYQGDALFMAGVSAGYAHTINQSRTLRLEYSIGVGYMTTFYRYYEAHFCDNSYWHAVEMRNGRYNLFAPTRAKVSLSWLFNIKARR